MSHSYSEAPHRVLQGDDGLDYRFREVGAGPVPMIVLPHFRGNLDSWDPALLDRLAATRRVVAFDNVGVGGTSGSTPHTVEQMAGDAIAFITALGSGQVDILGFSIGSFVAQEIVLIRPDLVRRLVLASSAPRGAAGMHGWAPEVINAVGKPATDPDGYLRVFYTSSVGSREAGRHSLERQFSRNVDRDMPTTWETRLAQYDAVCAWGVPNHALLQRLEAIDVPVLVANGDSDPMVLPRYSYLLAGLLPDARLRIYPDAAHGFLFQHHEAFAAEVDSFLSEGASVAVSPVAAEPALA
jgi:pimeloyl-ACP methyl ester carboxylesterase